MKKYLSLVAIVSLFLSYASANATMVDGRFYPLYSPHNSTTVTHVPINIPQPIDNLVGNFDHKIKFVFSDIDGTIIPFSKVGPRGVVPESAKKAADRLKQAQIPLFLATGRSSWEGKQIAKRMNNQNTYVIGQQGAEIIDPNGELIYQDTIPNKAAKKMVKEIKLFNKRHHQNSKIFVYTDKKLYMEEKYSLPYLIEEIIVLKSFKELKPGFTPVKIGICNTNREQLKALQSHLKKKFPNYHIDISADCYCDISSLTATKGNAIKKLSEILKIDLGDAAVLGDAENDISMLKIIKENNGLPIAVGNAMESVKQNATYVTTPASEGGWAKAIDKILSNNALLH